MNFACVVALALSSAQAPIAPQPTAIDGAVTHVYKSVGGVELRLHVFSPADHRATNRKAAIVFFFGGGWTSGTVEQFVPQSRYLAGRGMVAIVADYRVFGRHKTEGFAAMADAKSAIRWVRSHAAQLGVDPNRIAGAGGSSGGHIALSAAVFDAFDEPGEDSRISSKPNALVLFNPAVELSRITAPVAKQRWGEKAVEASPLEHVHGGLPRTLILHGMADTTVPYTDVENFCAASKKAGNQCQLVGYEGAAHGFFNHGRGGNKWYDETLQETDRYLTTIGYLPKTPSRRSRD